MRWCSGGTRLETPGAKDPRIAGCGDQPRGFIGIPAAARSRTSQFESGLGLTVFASSVCAGDYDNDGAVDLFITSFGRNYLFHNHGDGRFEDVTAKAGLPMTGGAVGIRLLVCGLRSRRPGRSLRVELPGVRSRDGHRAGQGVNCLWKGMPVNCGPKGLPTDTNLLYRNTGNGTFIDVSERVGHRTGHRPLFDDGAGRRLR